MIVLFISCCLGKGKCQGARSGYVRGSLAGVGAGTGVRGQGSGVRGQGSGVRCQGDRVEG